MPAIPEVGDVVFVAMLDTRNNGLAYSPGLVTHVWTATTINARVLADDNTVPWMQSLEYLDDLSGLARGDLGYWSWNRPPPLPGNEIPEPEPDPEPEPVPDPTPEPNLT
ncbi:hypothetical protein [Streptomyces sp. ADI95-17]|uniref:hypothetical protein n=1 Tax=Streptomyces sp. ADI95-17 TaxID=1522759 RepID=UPI000FC056A2|nr:hypothetical protein [Streptomyces sp. ADI95-17]RPK74447.1 hypothetical protein EES42_08255 [Streptomyces sp. ADI95-17]